MKGTVKWYNFKKGFGFIKGDDNEDHFVHFTELPKGTVLHENDRVSFESKETERGKQAVNVELLKEEAPEEAPEEETTEEEKPKEEEEEPSE